MRIGPVLEEDSDFNTINPAIVTEYRNAAALLFGLGFSAGATGHIYTIGVFSKTSFFIAPAGALSRDFWEVMDAPAVTVNPFVTSQVSRKRRA